jgi:hypothetical protein
MSINTVVWYGCRVPPTIRCRLNHYVPGARRIDPGELHSDGNKVIEHETPRAQPPCKSSGTAGRVDHYFRPKLTGWLAQTVVAAVRELEYPTVGGPLTVNKCCPAKESGASSARSFRQHSVEGKPVNMPAAAPRAHQMRVFFGVWTAPYTARAVRGQRLHCKKLRPYAQVD